MYNFFSCRISAKLSERNSLQPRKFLRLPDQITFVIARKENFKEDYEKKITREFLCGYYSGNISSNTIIVVLATLISLS